MSPLRQVLPKLRYWRVSPSPKSVKSTESGFTLIELLIVGVILGILATIAIPSYVATVDKVRYAHAKVQMDCVKKELIAYQLEKGGFPTPAGPDFSPQDSECFEKQASGRVPFDSIYEYINTQDTNSSQCYVAIIFFGKNKVSDIPTGVTYPQAGFYQHQDDLILSLGLHSTTCTGPANELFPVFPF